MTDTDMRPAPEAGNDAARLSGESDGTVIDAVVIHIRGHLFGIRVGLVRDVLSPHPLTFVHRAPPEVAGLLNLRGRIVTAMNLHVRLGLTSEIAILDRLHVVVESGGELYALLVDRVGDVISLGAEESPRAKAQLNRDWEAAAEGVFALEDGLLVLLDVSQIIGARAQIDLVTEDHAA